MKILFIACLSPKTGNHTTAERIRSHIEKAGHTCELRDAAEFRSPAEVAHLLSQKHTFEAALAIHLFRAGRLLLETQVPFGIIFGGTDINEDVKVEQRRVVMEQVLLKARFAVAFSDSLKKEAEVFLGSQSSKIYVQPQGIHTEVVENFCWTDFLKSTGVSCERVDDLRVFLLVCGLRRVKDPLYLLQVFSGICASVSETGVRWGAERETGEEWEALPRGAPQPEKGEGNLPAAGEHSAGGIRSEMSGQLWTRPQDVQQLYLENNTILTDVFLHSLL
ncbi:glycosyltransferase 1 domain-containing protein 1 isoform X2 [Nelusetta ayraudi]|uniref:glycosyltransferase 1 domain-containing protein 1 isoform X2 n=1 Tax=Nelusetta ayraudi TaxID=303726 RepID=UPI003F714176